MPLHGIGMDACVTSGVLQWFGVTVTDVLASKHQHT
jgi:hypothetical protein